MPSPFGLLGWSALEVQLAQPAGGWKWSRLDTGRSLGDIHNCSYAPAPAVIAIAGQEYGSGRHMLALYRSRNKSLQALLYPRYILYQSIDQSGARICFTQPSAVCGTADLLLLDIGAGRVQTLAQGVAAQDSVPVFLPDQSRIAYHSPDRWIEVFDLDDGGRVRLMAGSRPAFSDSGNKIAFQREEQIFISTGPNETKCVYKPFWAWNRRPLVDGLSWSPDAGCISFGMVAGLTDKTANFYLLEVASGRRQKLNMNYLRGVVIIP